VIHTNKKFRTEVRDTVQFGDEKSINAVDMRLLNKCFDQIVIEERSSLGRRVAVVPGSVFTYAPPACFPTFAAVAATL
jgi:hypothetical protein